jgi:MFS family permease
MLSDPVLRILIAATAISALGRGVFLTLTILYFTFVVGLSTVEVAIILTVASAVGVAASLLGGTLADRVSGRRLLLWFLAVEGIALACYTVASSFVPALVIACIVMAGNRGANTARSAIIGRAFTGPARVGARAALRTIQNVGVAIGSAAASIPLLFGTSNAYHLTIIIAAAATLASTLVIMRLPRRVDAARLMSEKRAPLGGRSAWRDPRYAALTTLSALVGIQFGLAEIGLPLWIMHETSAPLVTVSIIIMINTVLVVALQIPFSRGTHDIRRAGNAVAIAGVSMAVACGIYSVTAGVPPVAAIVLLTLGMVAHTIAEILSSAGTWGLSYELADPRRIGEYQGLFAMAFSIGSMVTPAIVTITVIENGTAGWAALAALLLGSALAIAAIARRAAPRSSAGTSRRGRRSFRSRPMSTGAVPT